MMRTGHADSPDNSGPFGGANGAPAGRLPNVLGLLMAVLFSPLRADLRGPWPWLALLLAILVGRPTITGQMTWSWPFFEQARVLRLPDRQQVLPRPPPLFDGTWALPDVQPV